MPVLGIIASQISGHLWAPSGAYDSISTTTLGSTTTSITFSSIPATYTHLQVRLFAKDGAASLSSLAIRLNSDAGANYAYHRLYGDGTSVSASSSTGVTFGIIGVEENQFGATVIDILDYTNTNKYTVTRSLSGWDNNGSGWVGLWSSLWLNTAAVNTITLQSAAGNGFTQYTSAALYGIKRAGA
jgi:hypothetical protein